MYSTDFIVLTSSEAISDLLGKHSSIYSDRVSHLFIPPARLFSLMHSWRAAYGPDA